jgi:hypothetical protein
MKPFKLLVAAAGATVLLSALVSSASARNFSISNHSIRSSWREVIFNGLFGETNCQVTLEGSLHSSTMAKVIGTLMGYITSAILGPCSVGTATIHRESLPWHVKYSGFEPRLPEIRSLIVHVLGVRFSVREPGGITCTATSENAHPAVGRFHRNPVTHQLIGVSVAGRVPTNCLGAEGTFSSSEGTISLQGTTGTGISLSLI